MNRPMFQRKFVGEEDSVTHAERVCEGGYLGLGKVCIRAKWLIRPEIIPHSSCSMKPLRVFLTPLDGILVQRRVIPSIQFAGTIYTSGWREAP